MWGPENVWLVATMGVSSLVGSILYMLGGTSGFGGLWLRRFLGSAAIATGANVGALVLGNWHLPYLLFYVCLAAGFSLGYGADTVIAKVIRRTIFALGVLSACIVGLWATGFTMGGFVITGLATVVGLGSVVLGVVNPTTSAAEQYLVCQLLTIFVPFWAFIVK